METGEEYGGAAGRPNPESRAGGVLSGNWLDPLPNLAAIDALALEADCVASVDAYKRWIRERVRPAFPHEMLASGLGHLNAGGVSLDFVVTIDFPMRHIEQLRNRAGAIDSPVLRRWIATREPQLFEADRPWPDAPPAWVEVVRGNGLVNIAAHGVYDTDACVASYQSFHRIPVRLGEVHAQALRRLAPILHRVLERVLRRVENEDAFGHRLAALSPRENQIAQWVKIGKTNSDIAGLSGLSENTVKHYLTGIYGKLGVETRVQLLQRLLEHEARTAPGLGTRIV
jgi:DNA-binding CsgD family transcriptional regulator